MANKKVIIIYTGMRLNYDNKKNYTYVLNDDLTKQLSFGRRLLKFETIGTMVEAENDGSETYRNFQLHKPNLPQDHPAREMITEWSIKQRAANEKAQSISTSKKKEAEDIDSIIQSIKDKMWNVSKQDKMRIARYVFEQLIK